jgi:hypothetical protein
VRRIKDSEANEALEPALSGFCPYRRAPAPAHNTPQRQMRLDERTFGWRRGPGSS